MDPIGLLLSTTLFGDLSVSDVEELRPDLIERHFARGRPIWIEGDRADVLVVVASGQLKVHRQSDTGREVIIDVLTAGQATGEVGLFHPAGTRWLCLSAMTAADCLMVRRAPLVAFLARHPAAMQRMFEQLSMAAVMVANSLSTVAFDDIARRVAVTLLMLADEHGEVTGDGVRIVPRLSQGDIAARVAASRENVNRALADLIASGAVSQRHGHFHVHDRSVVERVAGATRHLDL